MSPTQFDPPTAQVLLVDDSKLMRSMMKEVLSRIGLSCMEANTGEEAIRCLADTHVDLVLLDIVMPGMDGLETLRVMREVNPDLLVIMTTGERKFDKVIEAIHLGAFDYVTKPFQIPILERSVQRALDRWQMRLERDHLIQHLQETKGYLEDEVVRSSGLASVGSLAARVAHEFNNLIGAMVGYAELAVRSDESRLQEQAIQVVLRSCARAKHITDNLLVFAHRQQAERQKIHLSDLIENTLALLERDFQKQRIEVVRDITEKEATLCDPGQIAQVFFTVLDNARDAMPEGGELSIRIVPADNGHVITISDKGSGIPRDFLDAIFDPFVSAKESPGGKERIGLGLSVAVMILEDHNGRIEIESEVGQGTTVTMYLPVSSNDADAG